jgi:Protein of unknown function (DUF3098)
MEKNDKKDGIYFDNLNYLFLILGIVLIGAGYLMMMGGESKDPNVFNPEIFNKQRITYAPVTCLLGFAVLFYAIMRKPKQKETEE